MNFNRARKRNLGSRPALRSTPMLLAAGLLYALLLTAACAEMGGGGGAAPGPKDPAPAPAPGGDSPPPDCLTVTPCTPYPCTNGVIWDMDHLPLLERQTRYGSPSCPYHIADIQNSAQRPAGSVDLHVNPLTQPRPCEKSEMHVIVYGHNASGWTKLPGGEQSVFPIQIQGQCALSDIRAKFGGMPEFDRFRVLSGGKTGSGEQLGLSLQLENASP